MKKLKGIITTTHVDSHGEKMMLSALESIVKHINFSFLPVGVEHDPRIPPIGRISSASISQLDDGEYGVEATIDVFEDGDRIEELRDDSKEIPFHSYSSDRLDITYDRNFNDAEDQLLITEIGTLFKTTPQEEFKKALDPITVLTIGGAFIFGSVAKGFFSKLGADGYEFLKDRIKKLMSRRKEGEKEKLLKFQALVQQHAYEIEVDVILTNPQEADIEEFIRNGLVELDSLLPLYNNPDSGIKRLVFEYSDKKLGIKFGVRKDCVPLSFEHHKSKKDV